MQFNELLDIKRIRCFGSARTATFGHTPYKCPRPENGSIEFCGDGAFAKAGETRALCPLPLENLTVGTKKPLETWEPCTRPTVSSGWTLLPPPLAGGGEG